MSYEHLVDTRPQPAQPRRMEETQPTRRRRRPGSKLLLLLFLAAALLVAMGLVPGRTNVLLLGIDRTPAGSVAGRSDTMMLFTFQPLRPYVGVLSIPRDLWVNIPGVGSNRINTAHFFAESAQAGTGPAAAAETVQTNFGVDVDYTIRVQFEDLVGLVDALGGVVIELPEASSGLPAGEHRLDGTQALAFVRDRAASDDFSRMARGQLFLKGLIKSSIAPSSWPRWPLAAAELASAIETDVPFWIWPRLLMATARVGVDGIDSRVLQRGQVVGMVTADGAQVLQPNWVEINPILLELFGQ